MANIHEIKKIIERLDKVEFNLQKIAIAIEAVCIDLPAGREHACKIAMEIQKYYGKQREKRIEEVNRLSTEYGKYINLNSNRRKIK